MDISYTVTKIIDPLFGYKDLVVFDNNPCACQIGESEKLDSLARDNAQILFNQLYDRKNFERFGKNIIFQLEKLFLEHSEYKHFLNFSNFSRML